MVNKVGVLTKVEDILILAMEIFHRRRGFHPVDLSRMAMRCMEQGCRQGINRVYAPNDFVILLHPSDYRELSSFLGNIQSEILEELNRTVTNRKYLLAGQLAVKIRADNDTEQRIPAIRGRMTGSDDPDSVVTYQRQAGQFGVDGQNSNDRRQENSDTAIPVDPQTAIEEGVTMLREGHPEQVVEMLTGLAEDADKIPQYHALLGVSRQMLGQEEEARDHFSHLEEMGHTVAGVPLLEYDQNGKDNEKNKEISQKSCAGYRLEYTAGVNLIMRDNELVLKNSYLDPTVTVDGKVTGSTVVRPGSVISIGTVRLHLKEEPKDR